MIRIYIFTYAGDANEAIACVRCARTALPAALVTVVDDSAAPVPENVRRAFLAYGARYRQSSFPRNGNLRGPECVRGIISTLAGGARRCAGLVFVRLRCPGGPRACLRHERTGGQTGGRSPAGT